MNQGHVAGELPIGECNENTLGMLMIGGNSGPGAGARTAPLREGSAP
jgi:hypothetical protein